MIQETSRQAYQSIEAELGRRQSEVLEVIKGQDRIYNLKISRILGLPINSITPRVKELRKKGLIEEAGRTICPETGVQVMCWSTRRGQHALFI